MTILKNAFLVHNEYHLLLTLNMIFELYNDCNEFENQIFYLFKKTRMLDELNLNSIPVKFYKIPVENNPNLSFEVEGIIKHKPDRIFYFNEGRPINYYIISQLHKIGTKICLVQDGLKPYSVVKKRFEYIAAVYETVIFYTMLTRNGLHLDKLHLFRNYQYGHTKEISELWLQFPNFFNNKFGKALVQMPALENRTTIDFISKAFRLNELVTVMNKWDKIIFYPSTPLLRKDHIKAEIDFLIELMVSLPPNNGLFIKMHPLMTETYMENYLRVPNAIIFKTAIPAELIILNLKNSIILSGWSTSLLTTNDTCNFYYNYPIYKKDKLLKQFRPANPTNYIVVIDSPSQVRFPSI